MINKDIKRMNLSVKIILNNYVITQYANSEIKKEEKLIKSCEMALNLNYPIHFLYGII